MAFFSRVDPLFRFQIDGIVRAEVNADDVEVGAVDTFIAVQVVSWVVVGVSVHAFF